MAALNSPADDGFNIIPHDANDLPAVARALYIGTAGDVVVVMIDGTELTFKNLANGSILPIRVSRVKATGTTATDIVGLY